MPPTRTPAGRAKPEKPWPWVRAVVATRAASRITAAASSSFPARGGKLIRVRSSGPDKRMAYVPAARVAMPATTSVGSFTGRAVRG